MHNPNTHRRKCTRMVYGVTHSERLHFLDNVIRHGGHHDYILASRARKDGRFSGVAGHAERCNLCISALRVVSTRARKFSRINISRRTEMRSKNTTSRRIQHHVTHWLAIVCVSRIPGYEKKRSEETSRENPRNLRISPRNPHFRVTSHPQVVRTLVVLDAGAAAVMRTADMETVMAAISCSVRVAICEAPVGGGGGPSVLKL